MADPGVRELDEADAPAERQDHRTALAELAREHHRALVRFLTARMGSAEDAREVAQEAYAKVLALDLPDTVSFLAGYVWKTAGNLATDRKRQQATRSRLDERTQAGTEGHARSPEATVYAQQRLELLSKAMEELPARRREAFVLRVLQERSFQEVAQCMNIDERKAMLYVAKALKHCQDYLAAAEATRRASKK